MKWRSLVLASLAAGALAIPAPASAVNITGSFSISGGFTYDTMGTGGLAGLDFTQALPPPTTPTGPFIQVTAATDYFAGLGMTAFVTTGQILNITNNPVPPANYTFAPPAIPINVPSFLQQFDVNGGAPGGAIGLTFTLQNIPLQIGTPCTSAGPGVGNSCTEGPFIITQTVTGIRIDFDVLGKFVCPAGGAGCTPVTGDSGDYIGSFGVTIDGLTFAELGNRLTVTGQDIACGTNNLTIPCSFTANFNPFAVPEPATLLTFGLGSLALTRLRNRRKKD